MTRTIYINGAYVPESEAKISVMDRGFMFGDAIYEVTAMLDGRLIDNDLHLARFKRSVGEIGIPLPLPIEDIKQVQIELVRRNRMTDGTIYLQASRGVQERNFYPAEGLAPTFVAFTQAAKLDGTPKQIDGVEVALLPDPRWNRRDIKTVMLLGQVLVKCQARAEGFGDVWMHEDGAVTEGGSSTAFIITRDGAVVTRDNSHAILPGCTRKAVLELAEENGLKIEERPIRLDEIAGAAEAFLTSASSFVQPVTRVGDHVIGDGKPGPLTRRLQEIYLAAARSGDKII
ncbi:D-amino-acid transaminase [Paenirhodobacter enshiensis]|uniref:D-amino-acid transaminase n=1 Tax=Paenirhodobacter enshiensis TaxID=1105367 RepID=UPI0035B22047